jgi:hypothetical protein
MVAGVLFARFQRFSSVATWMMGGESQLQGEMQLPDGFADISHSISS